MSKQNVMKIKVQNEQVKKKNNIMIKIIIKMNKIYQINNKNKRMNKINNNSLTYQRRNI